jgi:hypothetical protein
VHRQRIALWVISLVLATQHTCIQSMLNLARYISFLLCKSLGHGVLIYTPVSRRAVLCDWVWQAGGRPHRFPHNNFSSVYRIFTKLGHMIPLWKEKNPIYFRVIRSKVKVTVTINIIFDNRVVSA